MTHPYQLPGYFWLGLLIAVGIFEVVQIIRHGKTMSEWVWHFSQKYTWLRWLILSGGVFLSWHFWSRG